MNKKSECEWLSHKQNGFIYFLSAFYVFILTKNYIKHALFTYLCTLFLIEHFKFHFSAFFGALFRAKNNTLEALIVGLAKTIAGFNSAMLPYICISNAQHVYFLLLNFKSNIIVFVTGALF